MANLKKKKAVKSAAAAAASRKKKAEAKKPKGGSKTPEHRRKVLAQAQAMIRETLPAFAVRYHILLFGQAATAGVPAQTGFFDGLATRFTVEEVDSFYNNLGAGSEEEIKSILVQLCSIKDAGLMLEAAQNRNLITIKT